MPSGHARVGLLASCLLHSGIRDGGDHEHTEDQPPLDRSTDGSLRTFWLLALVAFDMIILSQIAKERRARETYA